VAGALSSKAERRELGLVEEPRFQDIGKLFDELEARLAVEESPSSEDSPSSEEPPSSEVEELLRVLQSGSLYASRRDAAEQLGKVGSSNPRIVRALLTACKSDPYETVRTSAATSLRAPVHQEFRINIRT
jgi:hypothetical protein